jgi:hypothetical protein
MHDTFFKTYLSIPIPIPVSTSLPLPPLLIPILRITAPITQHIPSKPPPHHNTKSITHPTHQPIRPPRKSQRNLSTIQHQKQLRQRRLHVLQVAVVEVGVDVAETANKNSSTLVRLTIEEREDCMCLGIGMLSNVRSYNFALAPSASGCAPGAMGEISVLISTVQGPSCESSTLNVWRARAGMRTGWGSEAETSVSLPSRVKM